LRLRGRERLVGAVGQEPAQLANVVLGPPDARPHLFDRGGGHTIRFVGREAALFYRRFIHNPPTRRECVEFPTFPNKGVMLHPRLTTANWSMSLNVVWARAVAQRPVSGEGAQPLGETQESPGPVAGQGSIGLRRCPPQAAARASLA